MIHELLGGTSALLGGDNKISINGGILEGTPCPTTANNSNKIPRVNNTSGSNTTTIATTTTTTTTPSNSEGQNLRCPRCDSTNTKFCYYNNYNLTQPRHFCKTCRRYWTKGGALRNVPIGGGCRKNKNSSTNVSSSIGKATTVIGKLKTFSSPEFGGIIQGHPTGFDSHPHEFRPSNGGIVWASPQNSHILALLRAAQNSNSNPSCMSNVKDEGGIMMSHLNSTEATTANGVLNARTLGLDALSPVPSLALNSCLWSSNNQNQSQPSSLNHHQQNGFTLGDNIQNSGLQELYQRLRSSSSANYTNEQCPNILDSMGSAAALTSSSSTSILESAPVAASDLNYRWNPAFSWSDLPTTNGAYP